MEPKGNLGSLGHFLGRLANWLRGRRGRGFGRGILLIKVVVVVVVEEKEEY